MAMPFFWSFSIVLAIFLPQGYVPDFPAGTFTDKESQKIEKESDDIEERIKVYRKASERMLDNLDKTVSRREFQTAPDILSTWMLLITESLKDIEANLERKGKKSKPLIKYEIQVGKSIKNIQDYKIRAPVDQQDIFNRCIDQAESVRTKMLEILFNTE